ncbi:hypothetical protein [Dermatophilus congolensis]|uniref:Uncharacterized protein n=1 Tax=Dermatophilus congolensis TaxID=1863 RepID=A0A239VGD8_9MICO|nr:hypothetical protein [Dermatophilus congolensis]MBO3128825.1 hypothetical protein [Dermatophilus congolensis]MBO3132537.1 hypothetical protein [Dermatophilus congolensis]MBO3133302.1 hypothetical protein [Dermatophilus congolensis]MBO3135537.1 hypothetical protein [Dermatophilus congolensis]MBO3137776.1 hypothetical protein [Dermatophilus congolensis]
MSQHGVGQRMDQRVTEKPSMTPDPPPQRIFLAAGLLIAAGLLMAAAASKRWSACIGTDLTEKICGDRTGSDFDFFIVYPVTVHIAPAAWLCGIALVAAAAAMAALLYRNCTVSRACAAITAVILLLGALITFWAAHTAVPQHIVASNFWIDNYRWWVFTVVLPVTVFIALSTRFFAPLDYGTRPVRRPPSAAALAMWGSLFFTNPVLCIAVAGFFLSDVHGGVTPWAEMVSALACFVSGAFAILDAKRHQYRQVATS